MEKELAIITIHGMGKFKEDYFKGLESKLMKSLGEEIWQKIVFEPIQYQKELQQNQDAMWERMSKQFQLDASHSRRFLLFGFSDAASIEHSRYEELGEQYLVIQKQILNTLDCVFTQLNNQHKKIILFAHSLGGQIISNFLWDSKNNKGIFSDKFLKDHSDIPESLKRFRKLESCIHLITTGCNIPIFVAGLKEAKALPKPNDKFKWSNYYDKDDALGWPLTPISSSYQALVNDYEIKTSGIFTSWNLLSHTRYWKSKHFISEATKKIKEELII